MLFQDVDSDETDLLTVADLEGDRRRASVLMAALVELLSQEWCQRLSKQCIGHNSNELIIFRYEPWPQLQWTTNFCLKQFCESASKIATEEEDEHGSCDRQLLSGLTDFIWELSSLFGLTFVRAQLGSHLDQLLAGHSDSQVRSDQLIKAAYAMSIMRGERSSE